MSESSLFIACTFFIGSILGAKQWLDTTNRVSREAQLLNELEKQVKLRDDERKARIGMQRQKRNDANEKNIYEGFHYQPIAFAESPFPDRRGTPRQPLLVPAARGFLRFQKRIVQFAHFEELKDFSHVWVLFVFHENTNTDKAHDSTKPLVAKIKPPRLHGKKVGCLSTRSPHRPNNIGLSVCEILSIGPDYIEVRGIDLVHGTPIIDVKPYIPYDIVPSSYGLPMATTASGEQLPIRSLHVPDWVVDSDIPMKPVVFSPCAEEDIKSLFSIRNKNKANKRMHISQSYEEAVELIKQVLRQDIRSHHQGRGSNNSSGPLTIADCQAGMIISNDEIVEIKIEEGDSSASNTSYSCCLDGMNLRFHHLEDGIWVENVTLVEASR